MNLGLCALLCQLKVCLQLGGSRWWLSAALGHQGGVCLWHGVYKLPSLAAAFCVCGRRCCLRLLWVVVWGVFGAPYVVQLWVPGGCRCVFLTTCCLHLMLPDRTCQCL